MRPLFLAALALLDSACAPTILYLHAKKDPTLVVDVDETTTRSGATERQLVVTPRPLDLAIAQGTPTPGGPPASTEPLHFQCIQQERAEHEHIVRVVSEYDKREKLGLATLATFDLLWAILFASHKSDETLDSRAAGWLGAGVSLADAAVLFGLVAFKSPTVTELASDQPGQWQDVGFRCDSGLSAHAGQVTTPIDERGALDPAQEAQLVRELVTSPASMSLQLSGATTIADVDEGTRCRWAEGRGYSFGDRCRMLQQRLVPAVTFPLPASAAAAP